MKENEIQTTQMKQREEQKQKMLPAVELEQAETAGEKALWSLYIARDTLSSAKKWGLVDLFGGGLITDFIKHSKMDSAEPQLVQAKKDLEAFEKELKDIHVTADLRMEIGSFLSFADFFFDGPIADYMVQSRIQDTLEDIDDAIRHVEELMNRIKNYEEVR